MRRAESGDLARLDEIRRAAFAPVFASFRQLLGDEIYAIAQQGDDDEQSGHLASLMRPDSAWELYTAHASDEIVGFVAVRLDRERQIGEIGLNAVHPDHSGRGIGTEMYAFALERMREAGMRVATVGTGGDPSHAPARRAYEKAGFAVGVPSLWLCRML